MHEIPRLEISNLARSFSGRTVVNDISFEVMLGQVTCLLGPSGCGKSTTLRMIAGIETPDAGEIRADGDLLYGPGVNVPPEKRNVGLMFQDFALFPHLTVAQNIGFGLPHSGREARVHEMLERVNMTRHARIYPDALSGGEQQRVALARALAPRPRIMLMDEPFSGLDNRLRDGIRDQTLAILKQEGTAVLMVTHEPEEAMRMADQIALMRDGKIVQIAAPYTLYTNPADQDVVAFFSDINVIHSQVHGALAQTPFGAFLAPGHADGTRVEIVFRPQHVGIDFDRAGVGPAQTPARGTAVRALVQRARYLGTESLVEFILEASGERIIATVPSVFLPGPGTAMWLTVPRARCFVFRAAGHNI